MTLGLESSGLGKRSSKSPFSPKSAGSGQLIPASSVRRTYSATVLCEMEQLRAIARFDSPHFFRRRTSRILRMVNLYWVTFTSYVFWRQRMPQLRKISQRRFLLDQFCSRIPDMPSTESKRCRPLIPAPQRKWTPCCRNEWSACSGTGGQHPSESLVGMGWITQVYKEWCKNNLPRFWSRGDRSVVPLPQMIIKDDAHRFFFRELFEKAFHRLLNCFGIES